MVDPTQVSASQRSHRGVSRRTLLRMAGAGVPLAAMAALPSSALATAPRRTAQTAVSATGGAQVNVISALAYNASVRPEGASYFPIEDLGVGTDLQAAFNKVATLNPSPTLTLPPGVYECTGFGQSAEYIGFLIPPNVSVIGSGRDTVLRVRPDTVTRSQVDKWVPPSYPLGTTNHLQVVRAARGSLPITLSGFSIEGTTQHNPGTTRLIEFNGLCVANCPSPTLSNLYVRGIPGSLNSPPGETFGIDVLGGAGASFYNVEVDGRAAGGTQKVGGCGIGINSTTGVSMYDCTVHNMGYSHGISFWQASDVMTYNLRSESNGTGVASGGGGGTSGAGINHEKSRTTVHFAPRLSDNSLSVLRYWAAKASVGDSRSGDTSGHRVVNAVLPASSKFNIRIDGEQVTLPDLTGCQLPVIQYH